MNGPTCLRILCRENDSENVVKSSSSSCNQFVTPGFQITLQGTNISPKNGMLKMIFIFPRWDMLVPWRVLELFFFPLLT